MSTAGRYLLAKHPTSLALLPCPFCQGLPIRDDRLPCFSVPLLEELSDEMGGGWRVSCYGCHVQTWNRLSREDAIATWNRRQSVLTCDAHMEGLA